MLVYEKGQQNAAADNCYPKSVVAGVPSLGIDQRRLEETLYGNPLSGIRYFRRLKEANNLLGLASKYSCVSCEEVVGSQQWLFGILGALAIQTGLLLLLSGSCEHYQIKLRSACFSIMTFVFDVFVVVELSFVTIIALMCIISATTACDPDTLEHVLRDAGQDSTNGNPDGAAAFAQFFINIFAPMATGLCKMKPRFFIFFVGSFLGWCASLSSSLIVCCVCVGCTIDGKEVPVDLRTEFDHEAEEMQTLMGGGTKRPDPAYLAQQTKNVMATQNPNMTRGCF
jgi:hypothetical protein